jgi:hypothetical protein
VDVVDEPDGGSKQIERRNAQRKPGVSSFGEPKAQAQVRPLASTSE